MFKVVIATLGVLVAASAAQSKELHEWWNSSGLTLDHLRNIDYNKNSTCYKNTSTFRGCVAMINAAGDFLVETKYKVVPKNMLGHSTSPDQLATGFTATFRAFGDLTIVSYRQRKTEGESVRQAYLKEVEENKALNSEYEKIRTAKADPKQVKPADLRKWRPVDFEAMIEYIIEKVNTDPYKEGLLTANMVNAYFAEVFDAHTYLVPIAQFYDTVANADENFYGIGCELEVKSGALRVVSPLPSLPCETAGIQAGDVITHIDGQKTEGLSLSAAVAKIKGDKPSVVKLTVQRGKVELPVIDVTRSIISVKNVHGEIFNVDGLKIGYIRINKFGDKKVCGHERDFGGGIIPDPAGSKVQKEIEKMQKAKVDAFVLDLRGNPGGLVDVGTCVTGLFVGRRVIITQRHPTKGYELKRETADQDQIVNEKATPVAVLINGGSASASEFVAGALQDLKKAWLVGERTYGKATVQTIRPWGEDSDEDDKVQRFTFDISGRVHKAATTGRYHLPSGRTNQLYGISPDFEVPFKVNATEDERFVRREAEQSQKIFGALGDPWKQTRPEACQIARCLAAAKVGEKVPGVKSGMNDMMNDYQFRSAAEVLRCAKVVDTLPKCVN